MVKTYEELSSLRKQAQKDGIIPDWYTTQAYQMFLSKYQVAGEVGVKDRHQKIADVLSQYTDEPARWSERFFEVMWKGWYSPATPKLANTGTNRGMSVSCSGQYIGDSVDSFYENLHEAAILSKHGFGCSGDFSDVRPRGDKISVGGQASGPVPVIKDFATMAAKISQGGTRRGSFASYLDVEHPDFHELLEMLEHEPDGMNIGWTIRDSFIERLQAGDKDALKRFNEILFLKLVNGRGYIFKIDEANRHRPEMYKQLNLDIKATNLCTEIMLHSSEQYTYTCVLGSMNLGKWHEWKGTDAVFVATVMLDCLISHFIEQAKHIPALRKAVEFTRKGRAIGLGVLGFSSMLQQDRIAYDGFEAHLRNQEVFKHLHDQSLRASQWMAKAWGEPEWCKGFGVRNTHRTALAPTKSTATLMGNQSESTFPEPAMVYEIGSAAGNIRRINSEFYHLAQERGHYSPELIEDINQHLGSVQHLEWLTDHEKDVFKTAFEVDQETILRMASTRQRYLCQGQSLNFFVSEDGDEQRIAKLFSTALLDPNILSVYYCYSMSGVVINTECLACSA